MRKFSRFTGFDFDKFSNYQEVMDFILNTNCQTHELGTSSDGEKVYGISIGDLSKPMILIDGVMHGGHEWRNLHWVKEFMERILKPLNDGNKSMIDLLKTEFCFFAIPCLNPYGYTNNSYLNANGVNLNRNFPRGWNEYPTTQPWDSQYKGPAPLSEPESQIIVDLVNRYKVVAYVNTHTWGGNEGSVFETASSTKEFWRLQQDISDSLNVTIPEKLNTIRFRNNPTTPWVNEYLGTLPSRCGKNNIAFILEAGSLETHEMQSEIGMTALFIICCHIYDWFTKRRLILY